MRSIHRAANSKADYPIGMTLRCRRDFRNTRASFFDGFAAKMTDGSNLSTAGGQNDRRTTLGAISGVWDRGRYGYELGLKLTKRCFCSSHRFMHSGLQPSSRWAFCSCHYRRYHHDAIHWPVRALLKNKDLGSGAIVIWEISCTFPEQMAVGVRKSSSFCLEKIEAPPSVIVCSRCGGNPVETE